MSALQLEAAAAVLGPLLEEVVFVGGATIYLWITDPAAPPVRATEDVDVVCEVATRVEYYRLCARLRERGLQEATGEPVLCRWRSVEPKLVLDVMPTNPEILGFSNPWYEEAIAKAATVVLDSGEKLRAATPPLLVATKLSAWKGRGSGDLIGSLDVHDILTLFDGRPELTTEIEASESWLRQFLHAELAELQAEPYFDYAVDGATAPYGSLGGQRASLVRDRIDALLT